MREQGEPKARCPNCDQMEGVPLVWGKPRGEALEKVAQNEWVCGGCDIWSVLEEGVKNRECLACGARWFDRAENE